MFKKLLFASLLFAVSAFAQIPVTGNGNASPTCSTDVCKVNKVGVSIPYSASAYGSNAAALLAACSAINDGDTLYLAGETFDFGNNNSVCDLSLGGTITASLIGSGPNTLIRRAYTGGTNAPIVSPGVNHSRIKSLTITSGVTPGGGNFEIPVFNRLNSGSVYDVTDFGIDDVTINGVTDCIILNPTSSVTGYARHYTCNTRWDAMTQTGSGGTLTWVMDDTTTTCTPDNTNKICTCYKFAEATGGSNITFKGPNICTITSTDPLATTRALDSEGAGVGPVIFNAGAGLKIDTSGVTTGLIFDVNLGMVNTTLNMSRGVVFNPSRVKLANNTTINTCQDEFACPSAIYGGIIGASGVSAGTWSNTAYAWFSDAQSSTFGASPMDMFLANPTITTSNTNGSAGVQAQLELNMGGAPTRIPWMFGLAPGAAAGVYRNTSLAPYPIVNGQPFFLIGVNQVPTSGTALATVRGLAVNLAGTQNTILGAYIGTTVAANTTRFIGPSNSLNATENLTQTVMPVGYSISEFCAYTSTTNGAAGSLVITLMKGGVSSGLALTIPTSGGAGAWCTTGTTVTGAAGDLLDWKIQNNDATNPSATIVNIMAQDFPTAPSEGQLIFGLAASTLTSGQNNYVPIFSGAASTTTQLNTEIGLPRAILARNLYCQTTTCPASAATVTVQKNGSNTALTLTIPTSACTQVSDTTDIVSFNAGDTINLIETSASGAAPVMSSCSIEHD